MENIGFLGLGAIGQPIAERLSKGGVRLFTYDPRPEARARMDGMAVAMDSPREVAQQADTVFSCLASTEAHREALFGSNGLVKGSRTRTYVHLGTSGPALVRELGAELRTRSIDTVDAPITGGVGRAQSGTLTAMVSCARPTLDRLMPLMQLYANKVVWLGEVVGSAQVMKLVNNAINLANLAAACEALLVGAKEGLDPAVMLDVINAGSGRNSATQDKIGSAILTGAFNFGGALRIVIKDLEAHIAHAETLGAPVAVARAVLEAYRIAVPLVSAEGDVTEVIRPMEITAGVALRKL